MNPNLSQLRRDLGYDDPPPPADRAPNDSGKDDASPSSRKGAWVILGVIGAIVGCIVAL